jgi:hypothetical protein
MAPNPSIELMTLPEVVMGELAGKFGENFALQTTRRL